MLKAKDYRAQAWQAKTGKWGTLALTYLIFTVFSGICGALTRFYIGEIIWFVLAGPFTLGLAVQSLKVMRNGKPVVNDIFDGFGNFANAFLANLIIGIFTFLWALLLIIPGIIKSYSYSMTYLVMCDNKSLSANDARKKSMEIMRGNKWRLFCLDFSFIGWYLLCLVTLGILVLWIAPYHQAARAAFYQSLLPEPEQTPTAPVDPFCGTQETAETQNAQTDGNESDPFDKGLRF